MKLLLLGTGGYHPTDERHTACLMLPQAGVVLDAGTGMFRVARHLATDELDIFLTHAHLDHIAGLTYLLGIELGRPLRRITVHGERTKLDAIREHLFAEAIFPVPPRFEMRELADEETLRDGGRLTWFPLAHPGGVVGFRLDWPGHSLAYVTDTTAAADADYLKHIRGVDLLVHECYFPDDKADLAKTTGHSTLGAVAEVARAAGVGRLVLTHLDPLSDGTERLRWQPAGGSFPNTQWGTDGMEVEF